jgi:LysR family glycine cleavage system transcriptional activator
LFSSANQLLPAQSLSVTNKLAFLPYLRAFEAVSRLGTLRGAADELHLSPSAISLQLKKLSNITGVQLFARTGRNVTLTETGHEFYQSVSDALGTLADLVRLAVEREGEPKERSLSVSLPPSIGIAWLTAAIVEFATSRNMTSLSINQAVTCAEVDWHANDIAVVYDQPPFPGKRWELLSEVRLCAVCAPTLLGRMDLHSRDRKLHGFALLHEDGGEQWSRWSLAARVKLSDNIRVKVPSAAHAIAAAVQGKGIALLSDVVSQAHLAEGSLVRPFATTLEATNAYFLVWKVESSAAELTTALAEYLRGYLKRS